MPKFMVSIIVFLVILWGALFYVLFMVPPDSYFHISLFFIIFFFAFSLLLSIPLYLWQCKRSKDFVQKNIIYKKALKRGFFGSFMFTGALFLKAFNLLSLLNGGLFMLLCVGIFYQLYNKR
jgi:hypothetical protein